MKITFTGKKPSGSIVFVRLDEKLETSCCEKVGNKHFLNLKAPKAEEMNRRKWLLLVRQIVRSAKAHKFEKLAIDWEELTAYDNLGENLAEVFAHNAQMAAYEYRAYKKKPKEGWKDLREIVLLTSTKNLPRLRRELGAGLKVAAAVNVCRDLANTPGEDMTPKILLRQARRMFADTAVKVRALGEKEMKKLKMNGVLTVGRGSGQESQFIIVEYRGGRRGAKTVVLIGKGVTFDSGGIDIKPHPHGCEMMMDMSGAAAVLSVIRAAVDLKLKRHIVGLIPAVENMPGGKSMRPGDVIRMMDGTTVEVGHTDAEGRIILADALTYARRYKPSTVIDVATLTGAAVVALGERASAVFTADDDLAQETLRLAEEVGDYAWRLPLWDEYDAEIKGNVADISNINVKGKPGYGGAIIAAAFLKHFARQHKRWMHIDMAPTMTAVADEHLARGAKGSTVRLLTELLRRGKI